jgi:hypothetical protein
LVLEYIRIRKALPHQAMRPPILRAVA